MTRVTSFLELGFIRLDRRKKTPLLLQLYEALREGILSGQIGKGHRLPSTRAMAGNLGVSRMTVVGAFEQLMVEGYLTGRVGRGTFVSDHLPDETLCARFCHSSNSNEPQRPRPEDQPDIPISRTVRAMLDHGEGLTSFQADIPFRAGVPALDQFPVETWARLSRRRWQSIRGGELTYGDPLGYAPLRGAIAEYVRAFRGVRCADEQVILFNGTQQAIDLMTRLLVEPGDRVLMENPGYLRARLVFEAAGAKLMPCAVDENGMVLNNATRSISRPRLAYVTPSHQFPMGVTMSIERRMELIEWAAARGAIILEDDYDSEYRYAHRPVPSLQGLDHTGHTIYIGSFSKVIFPALGIGYAIVPPSLIKPIQTAVSLASRPPATMDQMVLTDFLQQGHFARHLRRMRTVHEARRTALVEGIEQHLADQLQIVGSDAGLHCTARLMDGSSDRVWACRARQNGILVRAVSEFLIPQTSPPIPVPHGLVFGFASSTPGQIRYAIRRLQSLFRSG
jgi:GntR family transcriptional regulator/MocR family aminotransferase